MTAPDVCVVGGGPAGLALATELAIRGLSVEVLTPHPEARWQPTYGVWADEVRELLSEGVGACLEAAKERSWATALVHTDGAEAVELHRPYLRLDTERLQTSLLVRAQAAGVQVCAGRIQALGVPVQGRQPLLSSTGTRHARLVVDATGRGLPETLALRRTGPGPGIQVAYGQRLTVRSHPWPEDSLELMDWRRLRDPTPACGDPEQHPTFLYALPFSGTEVFVEETVLSSRPARPIEECRSRLAVRLAQLGIEVEKVHEEEHCYISMGDPLPQMERSTRALLPFGAAAGLVHPATGYSLIQSLRLAPAVADSILDAWTATDGRGVARAAWQTLWPEEARRNRALYGYGLELLLSLSLHELQRFYRAFFSADPPGAASPLWPGYLGDTLPTATVARLMARVFAAADAPTRLQLMRGGQHADHIGLLRALIGL